MGKRGFTIVEILVTIAIIGVLSSFLMISFGSTQAKTRDARRHSDFNQMLKAMELCYQDSTCSGGIDRYPAITGGTLDQIGAYLPSTPKDPIGVQYAWDNNELDLKEGSVRFQYFCAYVRLETIDNTFLCISNKGLKEKARPHGGFKCHPGNKNFPCNEDCCGMIL